MQPLLQIKNLSVHFTTEQTQTTAVDHLTFTVNRGEIVALVGESGSGKSVTSLSILQLLPTPPASYSGHILFTPENETVNLLTLADKALQRIRGNQIAMIFQEPMTSLNPVMRCGRQVMETIRQHKNISRDAAKKQTIEWFSKVKLPNPEEVFNKYPHQLSGGQKQRVMIAMAMCCNPSLLICDEPTTALDVTVQKTVLQLIKELQQEQNMGVVFITHDLGVVYEIADRIAILYKGELLEQNNARAIFKHPHHPYTKALLACRPALHSKGDRLPVVADFLEGKEKLEKLQPPIIQTQPNQKQEVLVEVKQVTVRFPTRTNLMGRHTAYFTAVNEVNLEIYKGETLGLVGESGSGKSTLGRALLRLVMPDSGAIFIHQKNIAQLSKHEMKTMHKEVQLVFQDPYSSLNPRLTIGDAIAEPLKVHRFNTRNKNNQTVTELLDKVGLPSHYSRRYPHEFSGGQRQRIVIARALALHPSLLVCDESVSALDVSVQAQVLNLLNDLKKDLGLTLLFISHDLSVVRYMSDRIAVMNAGQIVELGDAEAVYQHPQSAYTKSLLQSIPKTPV